MSERISLMLARVMSYGVEDLKREEGQGATEYALVIAFVVLSLGIGLATMGGAITAFLGRVAAKLALLAP